MAEDKNVLESTTDNRSFCLRDFTIANYHYCGMSHHHLHLQTSLKLLKNHRRVSLYSLLFADGIIQINALPNLLISHNCLIKS